MKAKIKDKHAFSNRLRIIIDNANMTQTAFGKFLGVSDNSISFWLSGRQIPGNKSLIMICQKTHQKINWLAYGKDKFNPNWYVQPNKAQQKHIPASKEVTTSCPSIPTKEEIAAKTKRTYTKPKKSYQMKVTTLERQLKKTQETLEQANERTHYFKSHLNLLLAQPEICMLMDKWQQLANIYTLNRKS